MSIFFPNNRPKITYLFLECFGKILKAEPGLTLEMAIEQAQRLAELPVGFEESIAERLRTMAEEVAAREEKPGKDRTLLFADFSDWLNKIPTEAHCLYVANYDYEQARQLYCYLDIDTVKVIVAQKIEQSMKEKRVDFEAVLYGMGGKLEGDLAPQDNDAEVTFDLRDDATQEDALRELKAMGF